MLYESTGYELDDDANVNWGRTKVTLDLDDNFWSRPPKKRLRDKRIQTSVTWWSRRWSRILIVPTRSTAGLSFEQKTKTLFMKNLSEVKFISSVATKPTTFFLIFNFTYFLSIFCLHLKLFSNSSNRFSKQVRLKTLMDTTNVDNNWERLRDIWVQNKLFNSRTWYNYMKNVLNVWFLLIQFEQNYTTSMNYKSMFEKWKVRLHWSVVYFQIIYLFK